MAARRRRAAAGPADWLLAFLRWRDQGPLPPREEERLRWHGEGRDGGREPGIGAAAGPAEWLLAFLAATATAAADDGAAGFEGETI